jgi:hypothetical protein
MTSREKRHNKAWNKGFLWGVLFMSALFSHTIMETLLAILWWAMRVYYS